MVSRHARAPGDLVYEGERQVTVIHDPVTGDVEVPRFGWTPSPRLAELAARANPDEYLSPDAERLIVRGRPDATKRTYRYAWARAVKFCGDTGREMMPMIPQTVIELMNECWRTPGRYGRPTAPRTVRLILDVIAVAHRVAVRPERDSAGRTVHGYVSPTHHPDVHAAFRGYTRQWLEAGHRPDKAYPLSPDELTAMVETLDVRTLMGQFDAALLSIGYDLGARRVELGAINVGDVAFHVADPDQVTVDDYIEISIPMSKTDQSGEGAEIPLYAHAEPDALTCPVRWALRVVKLLTEHGSLEPTLPFLRVVRTGGRPPADGRPQAGKLTVERVGGERVADVVHRAADRAGLLTGPGKRRHVVPHSLRAGAATSAAERGADTAELNAHFRWSDYGTTSNVYVRVGRRRKLNPVRRIWRARQPASSEFARNVRVLIGGVAMPAEVRAEILARAEEFQVAT